MLKKRSHRHPEDLYFTASLYFRDASLTTSRAPQGQAIPNLKSPK